MQRLLNNSIFLFGGSYALANKSSNIVYDGEKVSLFGLIKYNKYADTWEMDEPLAILDYEATQLSASLYIRQYFLMSAPYLKALAVIIGGYCAYKAFIYGKIMNA